ncbi:MAG TPA: hypothetical protein VN493_31605 [Thermoanaerobaculia bacterium]|nr:hypothetical protein [Thermoanaerobaculia bacterium]
MVPFDSGRWQWNAAASRVEDHLGRPSLYLERGIATVADASFTNGWIEFDVAFTGERGFLGGIWRVQDARNYEEFYLRPHQSGNPDATQYTPVFNGVSGWQLYHGERYTVPAVHRFDEWTRVRILFSGSVAEIYIHDLEKPALFVDGLKRSAAPGSVGLSAGNFAAAHFSGFSFTATDTPPIQGRPGEPEPVPEGVISSWWVSDAFQESKPLDLAARSWTRLETERSGLANLARVNGIRFLRNTVLAKKVLLSDREQVKRLDFGFSDRVRVSLNGRPLFRGDDTYRSRDYRFLGSIGWFDSLYLPLQEGRNELVMAVSEDLGGWGVQAKLEDLEGIAFED